MSVTFDENKAFDALKDGIPEATTILNDEKRSKKLIERLEEKAKDSKLGKTLEVIPLLISCVKSFIKGEYRDIPIGTIAAIVSALVYWLSPVDIIPDFIPGVGHIDDAAVVLACMKMVSSDLDDYKKWLEAKDVTQEA